MDLKDILTERMEKLGYSQYRLTKEVCKLRAQDGKAPPVSKYQSSIRQAIVDPNSVKHYIIKDVIKAMGGELIVRWNNHEDIKAG